MTADVSIAPDAQWFRAALTVSTLSSEDFLNELAAAFAEDPERIGAQLLALHELNEQVAADRDRGDDYSADQADGFADQVRAGLAVDLPLDVTVRLDEAEARDLSDAALAAARSTFSARISAGYDPSRKAEKLRSVA